MRNDRSGVALMLTLWVLVLLTVLAMNFLFSVRLGSAGTRNFKEETLARYLALSAHEEAVAYLLTDKDPLVDFIDTEGDFYTDIERETVTGVRETEGSELNISISDEESRLNVNLLNDTVFRRLLEHVGVPEEERDVLADSLADWKDPDDLHHLSGAENEYYEDLGYEAKNAFLDLPEELLLIKGYERKYLYGGDDVQAMYPLITTWGAGLNINTASREVLEIIGLAEVEIEMIMQMRTPEAGGLRTMPFSGAGVFGTQSSTFRIETVAGFKGSPVKYRIKSVQRREPSEDGGTRLRTLYWKENVENGGA